MTGAGAAFAAGAGRSGKASVDWLMLCGSDDYEAYLARPSLAALHGSDHLEIADRGRFAVADTGCVDQNTETFVLDRGESAVIAALDLDQLSARVRDGNETVVLPPEASRAVRTLLAALATGATVHVIRTDGQLTAQQAADLLDVARVTVRRGGIADSRTPGRGNNSPPSHTRKTRDAEPHDLRRNERDPVARDQPSNQGAV